MEYRTVNCKQRSAGVPPAELSGRNVHRSGCIKLCPYIYESGYTLAGVLVLIGIMSVMMAMALPVWERIKQRDNEEELIFRGREYSEAIGRYHMKFNSYPPDVETLQKLKFIRKLYKDPMTEKGEWKLLHPDSLVEVGEAGFINQPGANKTAGADEDDSEQTNKDKSEAIPGLQDKKTEDQNEENSEEGDEKSIGPVVGVVSRSKKPSLRIYNGQSSYDKWIFAYVPLQEQPPPTQPQPPGKKPVKNKDETKPKTPPKKPPG